MTSARDVQRRVRSVGNLGKVTRAMEAVSATKMRRAEAAQAATQAYARRAAEVMQLLGAQHAASVLHPLLQHHGVGRPAVMLMTPDRGLTGGLAQAILLGAVEWARSMGDDVRWIAIGRRGSQFLARYRPEHLVAQFEQVSDSPTAEEWISAVEIARDDFVAREFCSVHVAYAPYRGDGGRLRIAQLLPIEVPAEERMPVGFSFEPSVGEVLEELLLRLLELRVYQALLESKAAEHMARMVAMRNAGQAADDIVDALTLAYNKARQADITSELLDIAGGAEAQRARAQADRRSRRPAGRPHSDP